MISDKIMCLFAIFHPPSTVSYLLFSPGPLVTTGIEFIYIHRNPIYRPLRTREIHRETAKSISSSCLILASYFRSSFRFFSRFTDKTESFAQSLSASLPYSDTILCVRQTAVEITRFLRLEQLTLRFAMPLFLTLERLFMPGAYSIALGTTFSLDFVRVAFILAASTNRALLTSLD